MKHKLALVLLGLLFCGRQVHAQEFSLDNSSASDDQVLNSGTTVFAVGFTGVAATVNGVDFTAANDEASLIVGNFRSQLQNELTNSTMSSALNSVLSYSVQGSRGSGSIDIGGLTPGQTYELQLFTAGEGTDDAVGSETVTDGTSSGDLSYGGDGSKADSIIETFVPTDSEEIISFTGDNGGLVTLSALNLRQVDDTTEVSDAPEPGTVTMCAMGVLLLGWVMRRRRALA